MITTYEANESVDESAAPNPKPEAGLGKEQIEALKRLVSNREKLDPERRATVEAMAELHNIPLSPKTGFSQIPNKLREQMSDFGDAGLVAALPMGGQLAGSVLGTLAAGPPGSIVGQSVGGIAGLLANKALGISNPDSTDAALTGASGPAGKLLGMAGRKVIPGVAAAEQQIGAELMRDTPKLLPGSKDATKAAYDAVEALGSPNMPVPNLQRAVTDLFDTEMTAKKYGGASSVIRQAVTAAGKTLSAQGGEMPFRDVSIMLKRYRQKTADLEGKGGEVWGAYKDLRKALFDDMAQAEKAGGVTGDAVKAQKEAMAAARQQIAKDEFTEMVEKYGTKTVTVNGQTFEVIEPTKILDKLKKMDFAASAGPEQWKKIESTLKQLAAIPKVDSATGTGVGTPLRATAMAGAGIVGATLGTAGTGVAGAAGAAGAIMVHDAVAGLFMSDKGRNFLVKVFKANKGRMGERTAQILQFAANQLQDTPEE